MNIRLTDEAIEGLDRLRTRHNTSLTALIEALGLVGATVELPAEVLARARELDRQRRSRR